MSVVGIISAVAALASAAVGAYSGLTAQKRQKALMKDQFTYNEKGAQNARDFNQQMDNTKYQRTVADMQAAGINPALAMNGGVSTQATTNASASVSAAQPANMGFDVSSLVQAATKMKELKIQEKVADSQIKKNEADAAKVNKETEWYDELTTAQIDSVKAEAAKKLSDINVNDSTVEVNGKRIELFSSEIDNNTKQGALIVADTALKNLDAERLQKIMPYVEAYEQAQLDLTTAKTEESKADAIEAMTQAQKNLVDKALTSDIIDSGMYKNLSDKYGQETKTEEWKTKQGKRDYGWTPVKNTLGVLQGVNSMMCNGVNAAANILKALNPLKLK
jgi:hypothetical protein